MHAMKDWVNYSTAAQVPAPPTSPATPHRGKAETGMTLTLLVCMHRLFLLSTPQCQMEDILWKLKTGHLMINAATIGGCRLVQIGMNVRWTSRVDVQ